MEMAAPLVIDPSVTQTLASGSFLFKDPDSTGAPTVTVTPQNAGLGYVGTFTVDPGHAANGQVSVRLALRSERQRYHPDHYAII